MVPLGVEQLMHIARQHCEAGRADQAEGLCRQVLKERPKFSDAWGLLGLLACRAKQYDRAIHLLRRAIAIDPTVAEHHANLGVALNAQGDFDAAIAAHRQSIELQPAQAELQANLGAALASAKRWAEAIDAYTTAIGLKPDFADAYYNLGNALQATGRFDDAAAAYRKAIECNPSFAEAHANLGVVLRGMGRIEEAIASYDKAIDLAPQSPEPHWNRAVALLLAGDYEKGWAEYEWRYRQPWAKPIEFARPRWDGGPLDGKRILIYAEQGLGDTIQFSRFIPLVAARGGKVILACQPELRELLRNISGVTQIFSTGDALPDFDLHFPLMSLAGLLGVQIETIPNRMPYLFADPARVGQWSSRFSSDPGVRRVGLAWAGRAEHQGDLQRSMPLCEFRPLAAIPAIQLYSLQKGPAAGQVLTARPEIQLIDFTSELRSFADTAALIAHLDLVISIDTAVAHLAAAMGKPVWLLLPYVPDWRWMLDRSDSPWYPTMRLFRQEQIGQWSDPVGRIAACLGSAGSSFLI